ncbi:MAG: SemiSWEET family transporter [Candidatus Margulisiibacteriota bacterium]
MSYKLIGVFAALLTSTGFVPQIFKALKTRHVKDLSVVMLGLTALGTGLWAVYGLFLGDVIIICSNLFTCSTILILAVLKFRFKQA